MKKISKAIGTIETDTPILPLVIAVSVVDSVSGFLKVELPESLSDRLAAKAERIYQVNPWFRRRIRGQGNAGRDSMYVFMRHWLYGILERESPRLAARLPASFANGMPLPNSQPSK